MKLIAESIWELQTLARLAGSYRERAFLADGRQCRRTRCCRTAVA